MKAIKEASTEIPSRFSFDNAQDDRLLNTYLQQYFSNAMLQRGHTKLAPGVQLPSSKRIKTSTNVVFRWPSKSVRCSVTTPENQPREYSIETRAFSGGTDDDMRSDGLVVLLEQCSRLTLRDVSQGEPRCIATSPAGSAGGEN